MWRRLTPALLSVRTTYSYSCFGVQLLCCCCRDCSCGANTTAVNLGYLSYGPILESHRFRCAWWNKFSACCSRQVEVPAGAGIVLQILIVCRPDHAACRMPHRLYFSSPPPDDAYCSRCLLAGGEPREASRWDLHRRRWVVSKSSEKIVRGLEWFNVYVVLDVRPLWRRGILPCVRLFFAVCCQCSINSTTEQYDINSMIGQSAVVSVL